MSKMQNLQQALSRSTGKAASVPEPVAAPAAMPAPLNTQRQPSRKGQINISAWLDGNYKTSLRLVQARKGGNATLQDLLAEALNDLFIKYDVPTIRQE
jgi:Antitoxin-like ribbon-helix-helix